LILCIFAEPSEIGVFIYPRPNFPICIVRYLLGEVTLTDLSSGEKNMFVDTFKQMEMFSVPFFFHFLTHKNLCFFFTKSHTFAVETCIAFSKYYPDGLNLFILGAGFI